jgi:hypothetical protein
MIKYPELKTKKKLKQYNELKKYIIKGNYPKNDVSLKKTPIFKDNYDNLCAMAALLQAGEEFKLIDIINTKFNYSLIEEMDSVSLLEWLNRNDLSVGEAVIIQPTYRPGPTLQELSPIDLLIALLIVMFGIVIAKKLLFRLVFRKRNIKNLEYDIRDKKL